MMLTITFVISFPLAVSAAIYLEEFAKKNIWTDFLEVNINNLDNMLFVGKISIMFVKLVECIFYHLILSYIILYEKNRQKKQPNITGNHPKIVKKSSKIT